MRVFVSGGASHLARVLLPKLCADPAIEAVTAIDLKPVAFSHPRLTAHVCDIRDPAVAGLLPRHDALVHLAFVVLRGRMRPQRMFDVNVHGSMRLLRAARGAGVPRLVHLSSAAVYGSGVHVDEGAPLAPLPGFLYGEHKALLETLIAAELPDCVVLRPHAVLGPYAQPLLRSLVRRPLYLKLPDPQPVLQCVHEEDVADAVMLALARPVRGAFNLAVEENFTARELVRSRHRLPVALPLPAARAAARTAWKLFGWGGEPEWVGGMARSLTLNCRRALVELGWRRRHDLSATLADA